MRHLLIAFSCCLLAHAEPILPTVVGPYGDVAKAFQDYDVILKPERDEAEWWAGAPSVVQDAEGTFWLACRMRSPEHPRGLRGYEIRILRSKDGVAFKRVHSIHREDVPIPGFERPALAIDPDTGLFKLYACGPWREGPWCIIKFDDVDSPEKFDATTARPVIEPLPKSYERDQIPVEYKDPVIFYAAGAWHAYVIGYLRKNERIYHFTSPDGETWAPVGDPYESRLPLSGWHDFFVRPASVVPLGAGYLVAYEGSRGRNYDPVYNLGTGLAHTFDLHHWIDLTPEGPLAVSPTPSDQFATFRYSSWLDVGDELWVYAECATPTGSFETRRYRVRK